MRKHQGSDGYLIALRGRAEEQLQANRDHLDGTRSPFFADDSTANMHRLVRELQVHQIELELQNEELQLARTDADERLDRVTELYDCAPVGYFSLDRGGRIINANLTGTGLLGLSRPQVIGARLEEYLAPDSALSLAKFLETLFLGNRHAPCEVRLGIRDRTVPPLTRVWRIEGERNGAGTECRVVVVDVTEAKAIEDELRRAKSEAESANVAKTQFLATMSHEFRTPLNAIIGFSQLLADAEGPTVRDEYVAAIQRNGAAMVRMIDDILELSRIGAGRSLTHLMPVRLSSFFTGITDMMRLAAGQKRIIFEFSVAENLPEFVCTDPIKLRQILIHIIGNAIKFTSWGRVTIRASGNAGVDTLIVVITDTGVGINPDQAKRIFRPFVQGDSSSVRKFGGSGIGLTISRRLAQELGGDVVLTDSALDVGSTFQVTIAIGQIPGDSSGVNEDLMHLLASRFSKDH